MSIFDLEFNPLKNKREIKQTNERGGEQMDNYERKLGTALSRLAEINREIVAEFNRRKKMMPQASSKRLWQELGKVVTEYGPEGTIERIKKDKELEELGDWVNELFSDEQDEEGEEWKK